MTRYEGGGPQSLHANSKHEALGLPTENAARLALRTQQFLGHETGVADVVDPLGGSYFINALTHQLHEEATKLMERINAAGRMVAAILRGLPQQLIERAAYEAQCRMASGKDVVVGINRFVDDFRREWFRPNAPRHEP